MKLKIGEIVYLQTYEVTNISHRPDGTPYSMFDEIFSGGSSDGFIMNGPEDGFRFAFAFKNPENVAWLMEQSWIVDFDVFSKMELDELEQLYERLRTARRTGIEEFNAKDDAYRKEHHREKLDFYDKLGHKVASLSALIGYRKGEIKFVFPNGYQNAANAVNASKNKKKPGFFARLFGRHRAQ